MDPLVVLLGMESVLVIMFVSRVLALSGLSGSIVGVLKSRNVYRVSQLFIGFLVSMLCRSVYKIQTIGDSGDLHFYHTQAALFGSTSFLGYVLRQLHTIFIQDEPLRKTVKVLKQQLETCETEKSELKVSQEKRSALKKQVADLQTKMQALKLVSERKDTEISELRKMLENMKISAESKTKQLQAAESSVLALKKQGEGFLLEYDRLLEENGSLRSQLSLFDKRHSRSETKKNS